VLELIRRMLFRSLSQQKGIDAKMQKGKNAIGKNAKGQECRNT
jgi:hypothetical protein